MKINSKILGLLVVGILFGTIVITSLAGWWQTETTKIPVKFEDGEAAGEYNPADIRGSYSLGDVSSLFDIPLEDLGLAFQVPLGTDLAAFQLKSLEEIYGDMSEEIGTASVRLFVALYKGLPYDLSVESWLLPQAVEILERGRNLTPEQQAYLADHTVVIAGMTESATSETQSAPLESQVTSEASTEHIAPDKTVVGSTTFQDLIDWGVTQADIEAVLGSSLPSLSTVIKDFVISQGLEFSTYKIELQSLIKP
jgi:hypothetical protein